MKPREQLIIDWFYGPKKKRSSGSSFSLTIPVAGSFTLTAAGNATGVTEEAYATGNGEFKGCYAKNVNQSINSGTVLTCILGAYDDSNSGSVTISASKVLQGAFHEEESIGQTIVADAGNLNMGKFVFAGTTAAAGLAFTCPTLCVTISDNGSGKQRHAIMGLHGQVVNNTGTITYVGSPVITEGFNIKAIVDTKTYDTDLAIGAHASNGVSGGTITGVGAMTFAGGD